MRRMEKIDFIFQVNVHVHIISNWVGEITQVYFIAFVKYAWMSWAIFQQHKNCDEFSHW